MFTQAKYELFVIQIKDDISWPEQKS